MSKNKVWFITGAGRGMGLDFAKTALAAGHAVVATGRSSTRVSEVLGPSNDLLAFKLDVTPPHGCGGSGPRRGRPVRPHRRADQQRGELLRGLLRRADAGGDGAAAGDEPHRPDERHPCRPARDAEAALGAHHFDLLVRGALAASSSGPPTPRRSSASKDGWSRCTPRWHRSVSQPPSSIQASSGPSCSRSNRRTTPRRPLRTTTSAGPSSVAFWKSQNGQQSGDPAKLARAVLTIASQEPPPRRFIAGADAIAGAEQKVADLRAQIDANRELSTSLAFD